MEDINNQELLLINQNKSKKSNNINEVEIFIGIVNAVREQTLEYVLHKINEFESMEEFKKKMQEYLYNVHKQNMDLVDNAINGN